MSKVKLASEAADREMLAYSVEDLAARTGIGRTTLFAEIKVGALRPKKVGRRTLIPVDEAHRWLSSLPTRAASA